MAFGWRHKEPPSAARSWIPGTSDTVVSQDLEFGFQVTPQFTLRSLLIDGFTAEFIYLARIDWESSTTFSDVPPTPNLDAQIDAAVEPAEL